jgi:hypothetical protein
MPTKSARKVARQLEASPDLPSAARAIAKPKQVKEKKISIGDLCLMPYKPTTHLESVNVPRTNLKVDPGPTTAGLARSNKSLVLPAKLSESQMKHKHWY